MTSDQPYRSLLFVPGNNARALSKTASLQADAFIFDLEDAVSGDDKQKARDAIVAHLTEHAAQHAKAIIRVNDVESAYISADLKALAPLAPKALLFPKVQTLDDIRRITALFDVFAGFAQTQIWVMIETPQGVLNAGSIMAQSRVAGLVFGPNDLRKELGARDTKDRLSLQTSLSLCVLAARASKKLCIDGVYNAIKDADGFSQECVQGRDFGFDGKSLIHPAQIIKANEIFAPSEDEIAHARAVIETFNSAKGSVAVLNGQMIEELHVNQAQALLDKAEMIAKQ